MTSATALEAADGGLAYRADVDGLRAVAVLAVVGYHAWPGAFPGGFIGVDVFFVVSGYLITRILIQERDRGLAGLLSFYARRVRRILPALTAMLLVIAAFGLVMLTPYDLDLLGKAMAYAAAVSSNRLFLSQSGYFSQDASDDPLLHTWSLSIEEQFYLLWPLATLVLFHPRLSRWAPGLIVGALLLSLAESERLLQAGGQGEAFYYFRARAWELLLGALLASLAVAGRLKGAWAGMASAAGLAMIVSAVALFDGETRFPGVHALLPCLGAALVVAGCGAGAAGRMLASGPTVGVGLISYSLYLWHWPMLTLPTLVLSRPLSSLEAGAAVAASFVVAWASWRWVELPFRKRPLAPRPALTIGVGAAVLVGVASVGAALALTQGLPSRAAPGVMAAQASLGNMHPMIRACQVGSGSEVPPTAGCVLGPIPAGVVVWGDSHAAHLMPLVQSAGAPQGLGVRQITKSSCPPIDTTGADEACPAFNRAVLGELAAQPPRTVIVAGRWMAYLRAESGNLEALSRQVTAALLTLRNALGPDVRIVVWGPTPEYDMQPSLCWARAVQAGLNPRHCEQAAPRDRASVPGVEAMLNRAGRIVGADVVLPYESLCDARLCRTRGPDGQFLYWDDDHLTTAGATSLGGLLAGRL